MQKIILFSLTFLVLTTGCDVFFSAPGYVSRDNYEFEREFGEMGTGPGQFSSPHDIATGNENKVYVLDTLNYRITFFSAEGNYYGDFVYGSVSYTNLAMYNDGQFYMSSSFSNLIAYFNTDGTDANYINGTGPPVFSNPRFITVNDTYMTFISDFTNVYIFKTDGEFYKNWNSSFATNIVDIVISPDNFIYLLDNNSNDMRVLQFSLDGQFERDFGNPVSNSGDGILIDPISMAVDRAGFIYVIDGNAASTNIGPSIKKYTASGKFLNTIGESGSGTGRFSAPHAITVDIAGNVYVTDMDPAQMRVLKFAPR